MTQSLFKGISKVEVKGRKNWFPVGTFLVEVNCVKEHIKQTGQRFFIVEFKILESSNPQKPAGSSAEFVESFKYIEKGLARVKQFIVAASGINANEEEVDEKVCELVVSEKQPLAKKKLRVVTKLSKTGKFTEHSFYPVE